MNNNFKTQGIDHLGLTVKDIKSSLDFFVKALGWQQIGEIPEYPAAFISDGYSRLTLWQTKTDQIIDFNRHQNIGLHHFAIKIPSSQELRLVFERIESWKGVEIEFSIEFSGNGPKEHFMIIEPGGTRLEFSYDPR